MAIDYRERKQVKANRPRRQPIGFYVFLCVGALAVAYLLGLGSGWFIFRVMHQATPTPQATSTTPPTQPAAPVTNSEGAKAPAAGPIIDPPLTFYNTLTKGSGAVIGTGLNPDLKPELAAPKPPLTPPPATTPAPPASSRPLAPPVDNASPPTVPLSPKRETAQPVPAKTSETVSKSAAREKESATPPARLPVTQQTTTQQGVAAKGAVAVPAAVIPPAKKGVAAQTTPAPPAKGPTVAEKKPAASETRQPAKPVPETAGRPTGSTFSVQVASYQERKEADAVKAKLVARGFPAYVVISHVEGKGLWYRVRVGRRLERQAASTLASRVGEGAIVTPE